jgi:hypothetical protein
MKNNDDWKYNTENKMRQKQLHSTRIYKDYRQNVHGGQKVLSHNAPADSYDKLQKNVEVRLGN